MTIQTSNSQDKAKPNESKLTRPVSPKLHTKSRALITNPAAALEKEKPREKKKEIIARTESKSPKPRKTSPQPFNLLTERRSKENPENSFNVQKEDNFVFRAREMPDYRFFSVKKSDHSPMPSKEFKLATESRGKSKKMELEADLKQKEEMEKASRVFRAKPIPDYQEMTGEYLNKNVCSPMPTIPKEPRLKTEERAKITTNTKPIMEEPLSAQQFKARKMPDFSKFTATNLSMRSSESRELDSNLSQSFSSNPPHLHTMERAEKRREMGKNYEMKRKQEEEESKMTEEEKEMHERQELQRLRKELEFKASEIHMYKPIEIKKSDKKLTSPQEFKFQTSEREKERMFHI